MEPTPFSTVAGLFTAWLVFRFIEFGGGCDVVKALISALVVGNGRSSCR
jgi:hypothetical protein